MAPSMDNIPTQRQAENGYLVDKDARNIHKPEPLSIRPDPCQDDPSSFFRTSDAMPDSVIMEEDEETASELAEPITPVSDGQPLEFPQHPRKQELEAERPDEPRMHREPLVLNTDGASHRERPPSSSNSTAKSSPLRTASRSIKKSLFRGQNANSQYQSDGVAEDGNGSPRESKESSRGSFLTSIRKGSFSSPSRNSPQTSQSNSPHSPGSPTSTLNSNTNHAFGSSTPSETSSIMKRPFRSSTGLSLRDRSRVVFGSTPKPARATEKIRSPSMDDIQSRPERPGFSIPAVSGAGLKARRMSATLPDDFTVETCELSDEFVSPSRVPLRKGKEIGSGATATVSIMIRKGGSKDEQFAVKEFRKRSQKEEKAEYEKKVKSEFSIAKSLNHPNIIKTIMLCTNNGRWNHVMEYCPKGELFTLVQKGYMDLESKLCLFKQLLRGVSYLHENGIAHRDIKLENLLLSDEGHLKITDFGVSEVFSGIHPGLRSSGGECGKEMNEIRLCSPGICGSLPYIAPEVLAKKGDYDPRPLDVWSCAIVFLTMYFNGNPWPSADSSHRNYARYERGWKRFLDRRPDGVILEEDVPKCGPAFSLIHNSALRRLLLRMLHPDPNKRISIHDALNDRWVNTIECCCVDPSETENIVTSIDVADKDSSKLASRMIVQKMHNHFPPTPKKFP